VKTLVKKRRLSVGVGHEESLNNIEHNEGEQSDYVEDWEACSEHECYEDDIYQIRVLVMDQVSRPTIDFNILRNSLGLCLVLILFAAAAQIVARVVREPEVETIKVPNEEFDYRP
jgi:hypothetical protein